MIRIQLLILWVVSIFPSIVYAANHGDLNCDGSTDVVDVVVSINMALGIPLSEELDPNQDNIPDACEPVIAEVNCGANTVVNEAGDGCVVAPGVLEGAEANGYAQGYGVGYDDGVASVDITTDNAEVAQVAFAAGIASVDITSDNADAFAEGVASVDITSDNADAFAEGVASVDITTDNAEVAETAFAEGAASVDITSDNAAVAAASYAEGVASVDITSDNAEVAESAFADGVASVDITTDNAAVAEAAFADGVASVDITTDNAAVAEAAFVDGVASVDITSDNAAVAEAAFADGVASVDPATFCGPDTALSDGICISTVVESIQIECGPGTTLVDSQCDLDFDLVVCPQDCEGIWGGGATTDQCGTCDVFPENDCVEDCAGNWGGYATTDDCGVCDTDSTNDCIYGCMDPGSPNYEPNATEDDGSCVVCEPLDIAAQVTDASCENGDGSVHIVSNCGNSLLTPQIETFKQAMQNSYSDFAECIAGDNPAACSAWEEKGIAPVAPMSGYQLTQELAALGGAFPMLALLHESAVTATSLLHECVAGFAGTCQQWVAASVSTTTIIDPSALLTEIIELGSLTDGAGCTTQFITPNGADAGTENLDAGDYTVNISTVAGCVYEKPVTIGGGPTEEAMSWFYEDNDNDGYGNPDVSFYGCNAPENFVENTEDCCDIDNLAFLGSEFSGSAITNCGDFDYNCDGEETMLEPLEGVCPDTIYYGSPGFCEITTPGWLAAGTESEWLAPPPACGQVGLHLDSCSLITDYHPEVGTIYICIPGAYSEKLQSCY